jgi:hypothetical protein
MAVGLYAFAQNATKRVMTLKSGMTQGEVRCRYLYSSLDTS